WSEGLLIPVDNIYVSDGYWTRPCKEADDVSSELGITHWDPEEASSTFGQCERAPGPRHQVRKHPKTIRGWISFILFKLGLKKGSFGVDNAEQAEFAEPRPIYDVDALKNYKGTFEPGEQVLVTEKIHGSNGRYTFEEGRIWVGNR